MTFRTMASAAEDLVANPRPVLFLDTCDLVNLLQILTTIPLSELKAVNRLLAALAADPQRCQPVVSYVTAIEFPQKTNPANPVYAQDSMGKRMPPDEVTYQLELIDAQLRRLHLVRQELGGPLAAPAKYAALGLLADLQTKAQELLDGCWVLDRESACVDAAVQRVFDKSRPSHRREVKDSIHLEHCLELARRVRSGGFVEEVLFASANKNDYGSKDARQPHIDLQPAFDAVQMSYYHSLASAIAHLGL